MDDDEVSDVERVAQQEQLQEEGAGAFTKEETEARAARQREAEALSRQQQAEVDPDGLDDETGSGQDGDKEEDSDSSASGSDSSSELQPRKRGVKTAAPETPVPTRARSPSPAPACGASTSKRRRRGVPESPALQQPLQVPPAAGSPPAQQKLESMVGKFETGSFDDSKGRKAAPVKKEFADAIGTARRVLKGADATTKVALQASVQRAEAVRNFISVYGMQQPTFTQVDSALGLLAELKITPSQKVRISVRLKRACLDRKHAIGGLADGRPEHLKAAFRPAFVRQSRRVSCV